MNGDLEIVLVLYLRAPPGKDYNTHFICHRGQHKTASRAMLPANRGLRSGPASTGAALLCQFRENLRIFTERMLEQFYTVT